MREAAAQDAAHGLTYLLFRRVWLGVEQGFRGQNHAAHTIPALGRPFLDIDMKEMSGLDLRRKFLDLPACIFITAYPDHAVEGFELAALDFLVKPVTSARFEASMQRLQTYLDTRKNSDLYQYPDTASSRSK